MLCATAPGLGRTPPHPLAALTLEARYYDPRLLALTIPYIAGGRSAREPEARADQAAARLHRAPDPLGYAYQLYAAAGCSSLACPQLVPHPSLILAGEEDRRVPLGNAPCSSRACPTPGGSAQGGGHLFLLDEPHNAIGPIRAVPDEH